MATKLILPLDLLGISLVYRPYALFIFYPYLALSSFETRYCDVRIICSCMIVPPRISFDSRESHMLGKNSGASEEVVVGPWHQDVCGLSLARPMVSAWLWR